MNTGKHTISILSILVMILLLACAPQAAPSPASQAPAAAPVVAPAAAPVPAAPAKPAWEAEWEKTLAAAKKEGKVVMHLTAGGQIRAALQKGLKDAYGINLEAIVGRTAELIPKLLAERRAGLYLSEGGISGYNSILLQIKPVGVLETIEPMLILPDVTDPEQIKKVWYRGQFPWVDKDRTIFIITLQAGIPFMVNTNLVKPDDIKSWRDLLNPKWKDKLVMNDPTISGAGQMALQGMLELVGEDFIKDLAGTKPAIMRDERQMLDWLAQGKVAIVTGPKPGLPTEYAKAGAPIKMIMPKEGVWLSSGASGVYMYKNAPRPNAAKVFVNWITSKEGSEIWAKEASQQSNRMDVSPTYVDSNQMRVEGVQYIDLSTEEASTVRVEAAIKKAKELFGPLIK